MGGLPPGPARLDLKGHRQRLSKRTTDLAGEEPSPAAAREWLESAAICRLCGEGESLPTFPRLVRWISIAQPELTEALSRWKAVSLKKPHTEEDRAEVAEGRLIAWGVLQLLEDAFVEDEGTDPETMDGVTSMFEELLTKTQRWDQQLRKSRAWKQALREHTQDQWLDVIDPELLDPPPWWLLGGQK